MYVSVCETVMCVFVTGYVSVSVLVYDTVWCVCVRERERMSVCVCFWVGVRLCDVCVCDWLCVSVSPG